MLEKFLVTLWLITLPYSLWGAPKNINLAGKNLVVKSDLTGEQIVLYVEKEISSGGGFANVFEVKMEGSNNNFILKYVNLNYYFNDTSQDRDSDNKKPFRERIIQNHTIFQSPSNQFARVIDIGTPRRFHLFSKGKIAILMENAGENISKYSTSLPNDPGSSNYIHKLRFIEAFVSFAVKSLEELSQRKLIHRDIKNGNITYNPKTKKFKLIDFDHMLKSEQRPILLVTTPGFRAPELVQNINPRLVNSDLYSFAITTLVLILGGQMHKSFLKNIDESYKTERNNDVGPWLIEAIDRHFDKYTLSKEIKSSLSRLTSFILNATRYIPEERTIVWPEFNMTPTEKKRCNTFFQQ